MHVTIDEHVYRTFYDFQETLENPDTYVKNEGALPAPWRAKRGVVNLDTGLLEVPGLEKLIEIYEKRAADGRKLAASTAPVKLRQRIAILNQKDPDALIMNLETLPEQLMKFMVEKHDMPWLYRQDEEGYVQPYVITQIKYHRAVRHEDYTTPAYCDLRLWADSDGADVQTHIIEAANIKGQTVADLLYALGYMEPDDSLYNEYQKYMTTLKALSTAAMCGTQVLLTGFGYCYGEQQTYWWGVQDDTRVLHRSRHMSPLVIDGKGTRAVLDHESPELNYERSRDDRTYVTNLWSGRYLTKAKAACATDEEREHARVSIPIPVRPRITAYALDSNVWYGVHVANVEDYTWQSDIINKLVLPKLDKRLIRVLADSTLQKLDDVVSGKSAGVIVLASGPPGTGKTLTAEVTTEILRKPLYVVQCAQLGVTQTSIEKNLGKILGRAERWRAMLLLDEADVYVRSRGDDINQNAIVGVFLRLLEYYRGFLFMTTNKDTAIDDAVLSRCTAHVRYQKPTGEAVRRIATVQAEQLGITIAEETLEWFGTQCEGLTGRDVRSIMKLSVLLMKAKGLDILTPDLVQYSLCYQDLEGYEVDKVPFEIEDDDLSKPILEIPKSTQYRRRTP